MEHALEQYVGNQWQKHRRPVRQKPYLFNDRTPTVVYKEEKPWHRLATEMLVTGFEIKTISNALNKSQRAIRDAVRQEWSREHMIEETKKRSACDEIRQVLEAEGPAALKRIVALAESKPGTPLGFEADKELLNRLLGRPTQPITHDQPPVKDLDFDELRQQVNRIVTGVPGTNGNSEGPNGLG